jgi:transglutaminase-like putative cysteine protease
VEYTVDATAAHPAPLTPAERAALLAPSAYLQVTHPDIQAKAREIVAGATTDDARVQALWGWVYGNLRIQGDIGLPRTALDVLREPVGMCRDYATLYAALARAAGIPTRVCAGIVYFRDRFYYHAWAESYAAGCWVPVDPTVAPGFVDATHIKFTQGDAATMYGAVKSIGRLRATILEQR